MIIQILLIETKYGCDSFAFTTREKAEDRLYKYVQDYWSSYCDGECPEDKEKAIQEYFDNTHSEEFYSIEETELDNPYL